jgi:alpha-tubulin suppressor-like RCC1 family protein
MSRSTFVLDQEGHVWGRGNNAWGQLGSTDSDSRTFTPINSLPPIKQVVSRHYHTLFLDNQGHPWGCGMSGLSLLGSNQQGVVITPARIGKLEGVTQVACGTYHSLFLDNQGRTWGCGSNKWGKLGQAGRTVTSPKLIRKAPVSQAIAAGDDFSLFQAQDGSIWRTSPSGLTKLKGLPRITAMDAAKDKLALLDEQGRIWAGQVNPTERSWSISQVDGLPKCRQVSCGDHHWVALDQKGHAWTWDNLKSKIPTMIKKLPVIKQVMAGSDYSVFLSDANELWGHGDNLVSQLTDDNVSQITKPTPLNLVGRGSLSLM